MLNSPTWNHRKEDALSPIKPFGDVEAELHGVSFRSKGNKKQK
jgi:hypothetical protein